MFTHTKKCYPHVSAERNSRNALSRILYLLIKINGKLLTFLFSLINYKI